MYKLLFNPMGKPNTVQRLEDSAYIPMDEANTDYQAYLKWVAEGNVAQPADTGATA